MRGLFWLVDGVADRCQQPNLTLVDPRSCPGMATGVYGGSPFWGESRRIDRPVFDEGVGYGLER